MSHVSPRLLRIMIPVIALLGGLTAEMAWRDYRSASRSAAHELAGSASSVARSLDGFLHDRFEMLNTLALGPPFLEANHTAIERQLSQMDVGARGFNGGIRWLDRDGIVRGASDVHMQLNVSMARVQAVAAVRATRIPSVQVVYGPRLDDPMVLIAVATSDAAGAMNGVIVGAMRLDQLRQLLPALNLRAATLTIADTSDHLLMGGQVSVLDPVAADAPYRAMIGSRSGSYEAATDLRGTPNSTLGYDWIPRARWLVTVSEPRSTLMATARRTLTVEWLLVALLAVGAIAATLHEARRLSRARASDQRRRLSTARLRIAAARLISAGERETVGATVGEAIRDELDLPWCAILDVLDPEKPAVIAGAGPVPYEVASLRIEAGNLHRYAGSEGVNLTELPGVQIGGGSVRAMAVPIGHRDAGQVAVLSLPQGRSLNDSERASVAAIVESAAQAFDRARLIDADRRARRRTRMLGQIEGDLFAQVGVDARTRRLVEMVVPAWADFATIELQGPRAVSLVAARHRVPGRLNAAREVRSDELAITVDERAALGQVDHLPDTLGPASMICVPLRVDGQRMRLVLGRTLDGSRPPFGDRDCDFADAIAVRAGLALNRARREEQDRFIGNELQQSLLRTLPDELGGVAIGATYLPGSPELRVGGDWFDLFPVPDGRVALCVGDVVGHGLTAATAMGRLSSALRAMAIVDPAPDAVLNNLEVFAMDTPGARLATVAYVLIDQATGAVRYRMAGHPPPLIVSPSGAVRYLWDGRGAPLCVLGDEDERAGDAQLADHETLLLFSDGLFERRGELIDDSLARLSEIAAGLSHLAPQPFVERLVRESIGHGVQADDVCVIAVRRDRSVALDGAADMAADARH